VLTALLPVLVAIGLVEITVRQTSARFFVPEVGQRLDQSLELYQALASAIKAGMRSQASAVAADPALLQAVRENDTDGARAHLERYLALYADAVSFRLTSPSGEIFAAAHRGKPVDPAREKQLTVRRALGPPGAAPSPQPGEAEPDAGEQAPSAAAEQAPSPATESPGDAPDALPLGDPDELETEYQLEAVFATAGARFDEHHEMSRFVDTYRRIERRREADDQSYVFAFAALLGITILAAIGMGVFLARGVSRRIGELAQATRQVGAGDLRVRVSEEGSDELADLARAFNRMLAEVESSRARIEYLQHIGAWQEMARRLAHEIKNPLTPIQLAVQEVERRYRGDDQHFHRLLQTTREIVEDEVGTLRRLVSEFSGFARLPRAELERGDLAELVRQQAQRLRLGTSDPESTPNEAETGLPPNVRLEVELPPGEAAAYLDRQMFGRVLSNLVRNAVDAVTQRGAEGPNAAEGGGKIALRLARSGDYWLLDVEDDGPGIEPERRAAVFDPYVTSKPDGTGLGLAIVKKIVVEHGGVASVEDSSWGGARLRVRLPVAGSPASVAALEASRLEPPPSTPAPRSSRRALSIEPGLP
jgi:nitrogen fixation/metabolism regulation signal transduction histidine kinase